MVAAASRGSVAQLTSGAAEELLEPKDVELVGFRVEHVPGGPAFDPVGPECRSEM